MDQMFRLSFSFQLCNGRLILFDCFLWDWGHKQMKWKSQAPDLSETFTEFCSNYSAGTPQHSNPVSRNEWLRSVWYSVSLSWWIMCNNDKLLEFFQRNLFFVVQISSLGIHDSIQSFLRHSKTSRECDDNL
jgi:hypothetical protein